VLVATLACTTIAFAQPANDDCANATLVTSLPFADSVDMTTATTEPGDPVSSCFGGQGTNSIWYRIPAGSDATLLRGLVAGSGTDYGVRAWTGSCGALVELECQFLDDFFTEFGFAAEGQEFLLEIVNLATPGTLDLTLDVFPEFLVAKGGSRRNAIGGGPGGFLVGIPKYPVSEGRLYDPAGSALGPAFPLADLWYPYDVAGAGDGSFFVIGPSNGADAVRVDGVGVVTELPEVSGVGPYGKIAADADGDFVVVWGSAPVKAQRYDRDGVPQGALIQATTFGDYPTVAMAPSGDFVVTWTGEDGDDAGIEARLFDASGAPVGLAFVVNSYTTGNQDTSAVGMDAAGNFVVAWEHCGYRYVPGEGGFDEPVVARRFDAAGTPLGPDFIVSDSPDYYGITSYIQVSMAGTGDFMVTWEGFGFTVVDIHARRFAADGTPAGSEFFVNTFHGYSSYDPDVAATPAGDFMVAWNDYRGFFGGDVPPDFESEATLARVFPAAGTGCATAAKAGCRTPTTPLKSKLLLLDRPDDTDDQLRWKFVKGDATDATDLGDPTADEDYVLCMYDASSPGGALLMENRIPAGGTCGTKPCWKALGTPAGSKGYRYKDNDRTPHGIQKMVLKPGAAGKAKVVLKGGQDHVFDGGPGAPALPLALPVTVQLQNASGACWQATYDVAGVGVNDPGFFKGSGS